MIQVYGSVFTTANTIGDFDWMIRSGEFNDVLFIFNDDEYRYKTDRAGRGNAIIRKYNQYAEPQHPHSAGITTGTRSGGYTFLTDDVKCHIDHCIDNIKTILAKHRHFKRIFYSAERVNGLLGTSIFQVHPSVLQYITEQIWNLTKIQFEEMLE